VKADKLYLVGFMGAGKTTVARALGKRTGWRVEDIDQRIEAREHRTVASIFSQQGEPYFRQLERLALGELLPLRHVVVATGGREGAADLLEPLERTYQANRVVVCYDPAAPPLKLPPFARGKPLVDSRPTAYVCHRSSCSPPASDWQGLRQLIAQP